MKDFFFLFKKVFKNLGYISKWEEYTTSIKVIQA